MKFRVAILAAVVCFPLRGWMASSFVHVDPRIELMTVVQLWSGYPTLTRLFDRGISVFENLDK